MKLTDANGTWGVRVGRFFVAWPVAADTQPWGIRPNTLNGKRIGWAISFGWPRYLSIGRFQR